MAKIRTKYSGITVSSILASVTCVAVVRQFNAAQGDLSQWPVDRYVVASIGPFVLFAVIFFLGHSMLRQRNLGSPSLYTGLGCAATLVVFLVTHGWTILPRAAETGVASLVVAVVAGIGSLIGFLHMRSAGYDYAEDDPKLLEREFQQRRPAALAPASYDPEIGAPPMSGMPDKTDDSLVDVGPVEYFEGPMQVQTSFKSMIAAGLAGGLALTLVNIMLSLRFESGADELAKQIMDSEALTLSGFSFILSVLMGMFFLPPAIYICHLFARHRKIITIGGYAKIGAIAPVVVGLAIFIVGIFITIYWVVPMAVAMAAYRKLAGLEPADLPEDIEVRDRRTLVGANHVRRRYNRVIS